MKGWRLVALIGVIALFAARMWTTNERQEAREEQRELIDELSRQQLEDAINNPQPIEIISDEMKQDLEETQIKLDSMRKVLEEQGRKLREQMGDTTDQ